MSEPRRGVLATAAAGIAGLVFGLGLLLGGMADPEKVLAFLDVAGPWDPSLALVMCGAIAVGAIAFRVAAGRRETLIGLPLRLPERTAIDGRLVLGAVLFGIGWGLSGICPGPALVSIAAGQWGVVPFLLAMLAGLAIGNVIEARSATSPSETEASVAGGAK